MKRLGVLLLTCISAVGQVPGTVKVINFSRADREHCRLVRIEGRPMRESMYGGLSAAVGDPVSTKDGYFRVFVLVRQIGPGKTEVKPKEFFALDSDTAHTRFSFYDKAAEADKRRVHKENQEAAMVAANSQADSGMQGVPQTPNFDADIDRQARALREQNEDLNRPTREQEEAREQKRSESMPRVNVTAEDLYLRPGTLRQGSYAEGIVYFRMPKGSKLHIGPRDLLFEVDILVNGIVFRFS